MKSRLEEIFRFGIIGTLATLTHFVFLCILVECFAMQPTLANGAAFLCAISVTYFGQSLWVFTGHGGIGIYKLLKFSTSLFIGFTLNLLIMYLSTEFFEFGYRLGFVIACLLVPAVSFIINKLWVFRNTPA